MTLKLISGPTVEPVTVQEVMAWSRLDASNLEPAPGALTCALASPVAPGNVEAGAHRYLATFTTPTGETLAGTVSAAATVADLAEERSRHDRAEDEGSGSSQHEPGDRQPDDTFHRPTQEH